MRRGIALVVLTLALGGSVAAAATSSTIPRPALVPNSVVFGTPLHAVLGTGWQSCVNHAWHCRPRGTISLSSDGGRTWRVVLHTPRPVVSLVRYERSLYARFDDGENLRSTDGGRHWQRAVAPSARISPCPAGMLSTTAGSWVLCTGQGGAGNMPKSVYRLTANGPRRVAWTPMTGRGRGGISSLGYPLGISGDAAGFGIIWESRGTLYVTRDGGRHWQGLTKLAPPDLVFGDSAYVLSGDVGYALLSVGGTERRRLVETTDAGRTWHLVHSWRCTAKRERCGDARAARP